MKTNIEIIAYKNGKKHISYRVVDLYNGVTMDLYEKYERAGFIDISIRII